MRKFINMLMILALVLTTVIASSVSHAMSHTPVSEKHDCHHAGDAVSDMSAHKDKNNVSKNACSEKDPCQCIGGTCHGGFANILGNNGVSLFPNPSRASQFVFADEFFDSALSKRLKRPPRA
jgi:hypothetical protein